VKGVQDEEGREKKRGGEVCWQFTPNGGRRAGPPAGPEARAEKLTFNFVKINV
jgi:hypothetical protein